MLLVWKHNCRCDNNTLIDNKRLKVPGGYLYRHQAGSKALTALSKISSLKLTE